MRRLSAYLREAYDALARNGTRSVLTMIGMIIGTASIIAVFGLSKGATSGIAATIASFGVSPVFVYADPTQDYPSQAQIQFRDLAVVRAELGSLASEVLPMYQQTMPVRFGQRTRYLTIAGDGGFHPDAMVMAQGRKVSRDDVDSAARVAVLTAGVAADFFGSASALGKEIAIGGTHFTVAGVYPRMQGSFLNSLAGSDAIAIPFTAFYRIDPRPPDGLMIYPSDPAQADQVARAAERALRHVHGTRAQYLDQNGQSQIATFERVLDIAGAGLSGIGAVALLVAGIGIMNIMLVSVSERTREIGIRKSIGASRNDVALQFLMEALLLALTGGAIGMLAGLAATNLGARLIAAQVGIVIIPYGLIITIAVVFSGAIGMVFGLYPALRAASMDPIEALRS